MTDSCIFCKIVSTALTVRAARSGDTWSLATMRDGNTSTSEQAQATIVYHDEQATAFRDIHPLGPTHILIVPNKHIESVNTLKPEDEPLIGHLFTVARKLAEEEGIAQGGYRLITNTGPNGGQSVFHFHLHLIGGQRMRHPMG